MRHEGVLACLVLTGTLVGMSAARADPVRVQEALALYDQGRLSQALRGFEDALRAGGNEREDLALLYAHVGILRAGSGDSRAAQAAFAAALDLDPQMATPGDSSPLVREPFERARRERQGSPPLALDVDSTSSCAAGSPCVLVARVRGDTAGLARAVGLHIVGGSVSIVRGSFPLEIRLPPEATATTGELRYYVELIDEHGSVLASVGSETQPRRAGVMAPETPRAPPATSVPATGTRVVGAVAQVLHPRGRQGAAPTPRPRRRGSILMSPWLWVGVGVVVTGAVSALLLSTGGSGQANLAAVEVEVR